MKHLNIFEDFENLDLSYYCEEFWDVDHEFLFELVQHEIEDNSLKRMRFIFEKGDKCNLTLIDSDRDKLRQTYPAHWGSMMGMSESFKNGYWKKFFSEIQRVEKEKGYPVFLSRMPFKIGESSTYKTSVYFEYTNLSKAETTKYMIGMYLPEIQLGFKKSSVIEYGNIGYWEDHFNSIFEKVGIPYSFDGDNGYSENEIVWYTLYHN